MNTFNFNSRETYIAFRKAWKNEYLKLSNEIRMSKVQLTSEIRAGIECTAQYSLFEKRARATELLELLAEAKVEAARQWAANKQEIAA